MGRIISARFIRLKKEWKVLLLWLLLPLIITMVVMQIGKEVTDEAQIPVGIVIEEETVRLTELVERIKEVTILDVQTLPKDDALHQLETHKVDSVFVFHKGYEDKLAKERFRGLVTAYTSNMSFAYPVTAEIIQSHLIQDASRSKAALKVKSLYKKYDDVINWDPVEVMEVSEGRQASANLLSSSFSYFNKEAELVEEPNFIIRSWGIWAFISLIVTFFMFDWILKENALFIKVRWLFTTSSFVGYALVSLLVYSVLLLGFDFIALAIFVKYYGESVTLSLVLSLILFRIIINILAFLVAWLSNNLFLYYVGAIVISLFLAIIGGALIPIDGFLRHWSWISNLSPVHAFLAQEISFVWLICLPILLVIVLRKERGQFVTGD